MNKNFRMTLKPFLVINYVFGFRIANLSMNHSKLFDWFSFLYMLLVWLAYYFIATSPLIYSLQKSYPTEYHIIYLLEMFISLLSIVFGVYYDKVRKF